jgi:hypothetical protein
MKTGTMFATAAIPTAMCLAITLPASAAVTITQSAAPAPTYGTTLNFDEVGGPIGIAPPNSWASIGLASIDSGVGGGGFVGNLNDTFPWLPDNNVLVGPFGVFMTFSTELTEFSAQVWDSGSPGPFGGGLGVVVLNDGVELSFELFGEPSWGGIGDSWFNITTTGGAMFDEVRILGFGSNTETYIDNMSWNAVPGPGSLALLAVASLFGRKRRRA